MILTRRAMIALVACEEVNGGFAGKNGGGIQASVAVIVLRDS